MSSTFFNIQTHVLPCQYIREYPGATAETQEDTLHLHIKQYTPLHQPDRQYGAITVIGTHANGFPKELYEPFWCDLHQRLKRLGLSIQGIWIADVAHQGASSVLNEGKLGNDPSWYDHSRDLLLMINYFRAQMPRPLVGIGHSFGGNILINLALMHPRLLSTLILIDPVAQPIFTVSTSLNPYTTPQLSTFRRDHWPSRAQAAATFQQSRFFQLWDERVLKLWIEHALRDLPTEIYPEVTAGDGAEKPVTLTTSKHQEVFTFLRPNFGSLDPDGNRIINRLTHADLDHSEEGTYHFYRPEGLSTFSRLPYIRPSVLYIFGGKSDLSTSSLRQAKLEKTGIGVGGSGGVAEGRVKEVVLEGVGHLVPMEAVGECASAASEWLVVEIQRWRREEEEFRKAWSQYGKRERVVVSEEWKERMGGNPMKVKGRTKL